MRGNGPFVSVGITAKGVGAMAAIVEIRRVHAATGGAHLGQGAAAAAAVAHAVGITESTFSAVHDKIALLFYSEPATRRASRQVAGRTNVRLTQQAYPWDKDTGKSGP